MKYILLGNTFKVMTLFLNERPYVKSLVQGSISPQLTITVLYQ